MAEVEVRSATRADLDAFGMPDGPTVKAMVGLVEGKPVAIGGFAFVAGMVMAFCDIDDAARRFPVTLHKTALALMKEAKERGHRQVYAEVNPEEKTARGWLSRLGFRPTDDDRVMVWQP